MLVPAPAKIPEPWLHKNLNLSNPGKGLRDGEEQAAESEESWGFMCVLIFDIYL